MKKKDTTESEIIAQIRRSLESYEEPYVPGAWEGFLKQRRDQKRKLLVRIASGIAACLLVGLIGLNYFQPERSELPMMTAEKSTPTFREEPMMEKSAVRETTAVVAAANTPIASVGKNVPATVHAATVQHLQQPASEGSRKSKSTNLAAAKDTVRTTNNLLAGAAQPPAKVVDDSAISKKDSVVVPKTDHPDLAFRPEGENQKVAADPKRKVRFGVNFSPGLNSSQSASSVNYTGGVSADIPLSSRFQLSTGLQVENQSLVKEFPSIAASATAPQNEIKRELINLDLPLNLTWKFVAEKSHAYYVSAGVSSLVHLSQEDKNTTYSQDLIPVTSLVNGESYKTYNVVDMVSVTQNSVTPPQTFDFAGRINLMVGFEKKLTNRFFIHIEPYAKFPTSGQSSGSFNYTTSGINFKVSF